MDTRPRFGSTSKPRIPTLTPRATSSLRLRSPSPPIPSRLPNSITTRSPKQRTPKLEPPPGQGRVLRSPGQGMGMGSPSLPPPPPTERERARTRTETNNNGRSEMGRTGRTGAQSVMGMNTGRETPSTGRTDKFFYISDSKKPSTPIRKPSVPLFTSTSTPDTTTLRPTAPLRQTSTASSNVSSSTSASSKFFYANGVAQPTPAKEVAVVVDQKRRSLTSSRSSSSIYQRSPPQTFTQLATPVPAPGTSPSSSDPSTTTEQNRLSTDSQKTSRPSSLISAPEPKSPSKSNPGPADPHHQDARTTRKILDLEISNTSLLAVNSTLERQTRKQAAELRELRRRMARGSLVPSTKINIDGDNDDDDDEYASASSHSEFDSDSEDGGAMGGEAFAAFVTQTQKLTSSLGDAVHTTEHMLKEGYRALAFQVRASEVGIGGRVLIGGGDESFVELESEDGDGDGGGVVERGDEGKIIGGNGGEGRDSGMGGSQNELLRELEEELEYFGYAV
ncbi:hypothetical protein YB2330_004173 [Saitoella coloradoensis]